MFALSGYSSRPSSESQLHVTNAPSTVVVLFNLMVFRLLCYVVCFLCTEQSFLTSCRTVLQLNLTSWKGLVLHDNCAAACQDHDVQLLLLVVSLLVPLPHYIRVMGWNQSNLRTGRKKGVQNMSNIIKANKNLKRLFYQLLHFLIV